jgi:hypothetical protein
MDIQAVKKGLYVFALGNWSQMILGLSAVVASTIYHYH